MSTRATILFRDGNYKYFVYRHHDGFPENIIPDIQKAIDCIVRKINCENFGQLVSTFFALNYEPASRCQSYEITPCFHGDEDFQYYVQWCEKSKTYIVTYE